MFNRKKDLSEKAATVKKFEYLPLGSELNKELLQENSTKAYKIYKNEHKTST